MCAARWTACRSTGLVGRLRRELLDRMMIVGPGHARRVRGALQRTSCLPEPEATPSQRRRADGTSGRRSSMNDGPYAGRSFVASSTNATKPPERSRETAVQSRTIVASCAVRDGRSPGAGTRTRIPAGGARKNAYRRRHEQRVRLEHAGGIPAVSRSVRGQMAHRHPAPCVMTCQRRQAFNGSHLRAPEVTDDSRAPQRLPSVPCSLRSHHTGVTPS